MDLTTISSTYPSIDEINALPDKVRKYIHDLETRMSTEGKALKILELANKRNAIAAPGRGVGTRGRTSQANPRLGGSGCVAESSESDRVATSLDSMAMLQLCHSSNVIRYAELQTAAIFTESFHLLRDSNLSIQALLSPYC